MRTLGIDLAAGEARTAACFIDWGDDVGVTRTPHLGLSDDRLLEEIAVADKVAIDAPFGWPEGFVQAVSSYADGGPWPAVDRSTLRYRETDRAIAGDGRPPLSVSSDLIAVTAMRCALLLTRLAEHGVAVDRAGSGLVVEVYPAAALRVWGFKPGRYKETSGRQARVALVAELVERCRPWLEFTDDCVAMCEASDHALDAVVCALVARAKALGATRDIPEDLLTAARREGWIHIPAANSSTSLGAGYRGG
jgi:predicted nuclease with RNAse H fold